MGERLRVCVLMCWMIGCGDVVDSDADANADQADANAGEVDAAACASGTPLAEQTPGDCKVVVCDGNGGTDVRNDDSDVPEGDVECAAWSCQQGSPTQAPAAAFTACTNETGVCDGAGRCVTCVGDTDCFSDGSDGGFHATADTELPGGTYDFTSFVIDADVTVRVTGPDPLVIKTQQDAVIHGALRADGGAGGSGVTFASAGAAGVAVAGGGDGGAGYFVDNGGPFPGSAGAGAGAGAGGTSWGPGGGGSYGTAGGDATLGDGTAGATYGDATLTNLAGGSGGGGGSGGNNCGGGGGGAGGGVVRLTVFGTLTVGPSGVISARGGNGGTDGGGSCGGGAGGSGGAVWLRAPTIVHDGVIDASGGAGGSGWQGNVGGAGGVGRIRIDVVDQSGTGVTTPASGANGGAWYE